MADQFSLEEKELVEMIDVMFFDMKKLLTSPKMPEIILHFFGKLTPSVKYMKYRISKNIGLIREFREKDENKYERMIEILKFKIKKYWATVKRKEAEKRGILTWYCWRDLNDDLEGYKDCNKYTGKNCQRCKEAEELAKKTI